MPIMASVSPTAFKAASRLQNVFWQHSAFPAHQHYPRNLTRRSKTMPAHDYQYADFDHSPLMFYYEVTQACDLVCKHCRAYAVTGDPLESEPDCLYVPTETLQESLP